MVRPKTWDGSRVLVVLNAIVFERSSGVHYAATVVMCEAGSALLLAGRTLFKQA
jgi:hypothetical protein